MDQQEVPICDMKNYNTELMRLSNLTIDKFLWRSYCRQGVEELAKHRKDLQGTRRGCKQTLQEYPLPVSLDHHTRTVAGDALHEQDKTVIRERMMQEGTTIRTTMNYLK